MARCRVQAAASWRRLHTPVVSTPTEADMGWTCGCKPGSRCTGYSAVPADSCRAVYKTFRLLDSRAHDIGRFWKNSLAATEQALLAWR